MRALDLKQKMPNFLDQCTAIAKACNLWKTNVRNAINEFKNFPIK